MEKLGESDGRAKVMLGLLESVERDARGTQRSRANEFGVALGLVNAYLNFCIKKGYVRARKVPMRRYAYFLTPKGLAEKSRLSLMLISKSLGSFRKAREDYCNAFQAFRAQGYNRIVLVGTSELAEIATICAAENGIILMAIVQPGAPELDLVGLPVVPRLADVPGKFDAAVITDLRAPQQTYDRTVAALGAERVAAPAILGVVTVQRRQAAE